MKFGLFYQLPCAPTQAERTRYHETLEQIVYADELGFDTAWLAELHFNRPFSIMPAPLIVPGWQTGAVVCWIDARNGNNDVYAQRLDWSGRLGDPQLAG